MPVRVVHLVAKTHLDLGFTALASEVEQQYLRDFFPRALSVAADLRESGGSEQLVWTTGSWILHRALHQADPGQATAVEAGVRAGSLAWHALPLTTHTELMDAALFRAGLGISRELDDRFGRSTTAAKMTDVPGHTRAMVPLLAEAGVTFLHLGVNPAWPVPDVPPVFRWRTPAADGGPSEVVVAYSAGGYGGELVVPGCDEALAFLHAGDNLGPPSADDVRAAHAELRSRYPEAEVRASTLDAFARAVAASSAVDGLPVVTSEIGDPWIFGAGSDPQKVGVYRELLRTRGRTGLGRRLTSEEHRALDRQLLLVAEHTWGMDQKIALPEDRRWDAPGLAEVRSSAGGRRIEASWTEQRAYVDGAVYSFERAVVPHLRYGDDPPDLARARSAGERIVSTISDRAIRGGPIQPDIPDHPQARYERVGAGGPVPDPEGSMTEGFDPPAVRAARFTEDGASPDRPESHWDVAISPVTGAIDRLVHRPTGRVLADPSHPLGLVVHQAFGEADYERFYRQLTPAPEDEGWARWDNTKPGIDGCGAVSASWSPSTVMVWTSNRQDEWWRDIVIRSAFPDEAIGYGAPSEVWQRWWFATEGDELEHDVWWNDRAATRLPSATWCSYVPAVAEPERWEIDKLGQRISPLDVVRRGGRSLHGVGEGMHYDGPDGRLRIEPHDAPLVAPGRPNLLDADPPVPDLAGGWHVLLHDNLWGTNFPMWNEGPARFRATLSIT